MILVIDNYDSFTFNLVQAIARLGEEPVVVRNDRASLAELERLRPAALVVSPGPCGPDQAGISVPAIRHFQGRIPILGVCLGHQCLAAVRGARIVPATTPCHGRAVAIRHDGTGLFAGVPSPSRVALYHSLMVDPSTLPPALRPTSYTEDKTIMSIEDPAGSAFGVQFHPESFMSTDGDSIIVNFISTSRAASHELCRPCR